MGESQGAMTEPFSYKADANCAPARSAKKRMVGFSQWLGQSERNLGKATQAGGVTATFIMYFHYRSSCPVPSLTMKENLP
jgi:hypothetical protein